MPSGQTGTLHSQGIGGNVRRYYLLTSSVTVLSALHDLPASKSRMRRSRKAHTDALNIEPMPLEVRWIRQRDLQDGIM